MRILKKMTGVVNIIIYVAVLFHYLKKRVRTPWDRLCPGSACGDLCSVQIMSLVENSMAWTLLHKSWPQKYLAELGALIDEHKDGAESSRAGTV